MFSSTLQRDHGFMIFFLIFMGFGVILDFVQIFVIGQTYIALPIVSALLSIYFFLSILSLFYKIQRENAGNV